MDIGDFILVQVILGIIVKNTEQAMGSKPVQSLCSGPSLGFLPWLPSAVDGAKETKAGNILLIPCPSGQCSITTTGESPDNCFNFFLLFSVHFLSRGQTYLSKTIYVRRRHCTRCWVKALDDKVDMLNIQPDQLVFLSIPC